MHLILDAGSGLWSNLWRPALACHAKPDKGFQTACYIISNSSVSIYVEDIPFKSGKRIKELKKETPQCFWTRKSSGDSLWPWNSIVPGPKLPSAGPPKRKQRRHQKLHGFSLKRCWRGVQSPSCLDAAAFNNVCWMYHSCPAQRKHTMPAMKYGQ